MSQRERLREFRAAVFRADGEALVLLLRAGPWPGHALQLIGDGLLAALAQNISRARELAERCVTELREREWEGDEDLVAALTARLGAGPDPLLRSLPVDLDELADVLEGDPVAGGGRIDLHSGEVWPQAVFDYGFESEEEDEDLDDAEPGCGSPARAHARGTATWSCSSSGSPNQTSPTGWLGRWRVGARSVVSATS